MSSAAWHARIVCGNEVGAGFLVSARRVLTCAHVVRWSDESAVTVTFPHDRGLGLGEVSATVAVLGGWAGAVTDPGDLAVLELDRDIPFAPAEFAPPGDAYGDPSPKLIAYGFPRGYDEGTLAEYRAASEQLIADEWIQLESWTAHGQPLAAGFSGAAVVLADSGRVVGMVSSVAGAREVRNGRMLPTRVMTRYWPELGELVPTPDHRPAVKERLRTLVRQAESARLECDPNRLYVDAVGPFGPPLPDEGFDRLWAAAWYVQWEVTDPEAVTRFADRLAELLDAPARRGPAPAPVWSPILVEIDHSGAGGDRASVVVSAYRDGQRRAVGARQLPRSRVRAYIQERIDEAFTQLTPGAEELIAFVLPRAWLNEPVAQWECGADDPTPLGCAYPLVVTDRSRRRGGVRHQLTRRWEKLDAGSGTSLHRVECGSQEKPSRLRLRLRRDDTDLAGFTAPPGAAEAHFEATLNAPVPVLVWPRTGCPAPEHDGPCAGTAFLDELTAYVTGVPPAELPRHFLTLRETADAADDPDRHWARDVQLLWDDPRCFPEPTVSPHSPVI
ncbi:VMAP-C domain-containing protein [Streptomyces sp. NPDC002156]